MLCVSNKERGDAKVFWAGTRFRRVRVEEMKRRRDASREQEDAREEIRTRGGW